MNDGDAIYPLTTADQVIKTDGSKLEQDGKIAVDSATKADNAEKLAGKAAEYYIQPRNLLDNSDFSNPVNQRNKTYVNTQNTYFIDRWKFDKNDDSTQNVSAGVNSDYHWVYLSNQNTDTNTWSALYHLVSAEYLEAGKYTLVFHERTTATIPFVMLIDGKPAISGVSYSPNENGVVIIPFELGSKPTTSILLAIYATPGTLVTFDWAALYKGVYTADTLPPYVPKGYAAELAECKRYYEVVNAGAGKIRFSGFSCGIMNDTTSAYFLIRYSEKRIIPSAILTGKFRVYVNGSGQAISTSDIATDQASTRCLRLICSNIPNGIAGQACELQANGDSTATIAISADL